MTTHGKWSIKKKTAFTLLANVLLFLAGELAARVYDFSKPRKDLLDLQFMSNPVTIMEPHPYICYVANPGYREHNSQGFRGTAAYKLSFNGLRVACLGGSTTYDTRVPESASYPRQLETLLRGKLDDKVEVINAGLGGYSSHNLVGLLAFRIVPLKPDICIFDVGHNDAWNRIHFSNFQVDNSHAQRTWKSIEYGLPLWRRSMLLNKIAFKLGYPPAGPPHIHQVCWHPVMGEEVANWNSSSFDAFRNNVRTMIAICRMHKIIPIFSIQASDFEHHQGASLFAQAMDESAAVLEEVCGEHDVDVIDLRKSMDDQRQLFSDYLHTSVEGSLMRAQLIADFLASDEGGRKNPF